MLRRGPEYLVAVLVQPSEPQRDPIAPIQNRVPAQEFVPEDLDILGTASEIMIIEAVDA